MSSANSTAGPFARPASVNLGTTYGAFLIGVIAAAIFYGILVSQTMFYFNTYPRDSRGLKFFVSLLLLLETIATVFETHAIYEYLIVSFGNLDKLQTQIWSVQAEAVIVYTIMFLTQAYFAMRIWELSGRKWIFVGFLILLILAAYGTSLATVVFVFEVKTWNSPQLHRLKNIVPANKVFETIVDALITGGLCYHLHQKRSSLPKTNHMINRLMMFAMERGVLTTFLQLCYLIAYEIKSTNLAWTAIHVVVSKVYSNTVIATLNSRRAMRDLGALSSNHTQPIHFATTTPSEMQPKSEAYESASTIPVGGDEDQPQPGLAGRDTV